METKKVIIPTVLIILLLITLVVGATFAYFSVDILDNSQIVKASATTETVGNVSLSAGSNLKLTLTASDMMNNNGDVNYYATISGTPATDETEVAIATASVTGNGTMNCTYKMSAKITGTNNMYDAFQGMTNKSTNQLVLMVDGTEYDFYDITFPKEINGTITGINSSVDKDILASFKVVNRSDIIQNDLAGTDLVISFAVTEFVCQIVG